MSKSKILFIMTGSIASYKACAVLSKLKQSGHEIKVVMSPSSLKFIGPATIEGLIGSPPITDMYAEGQVMDHIHLIRWCDLVVVAPATAHFINRIANGIGDDLLTTLFLAHDFKRPFLVAPAMNTMMYLHPTTQISIKKLKEMSVEILETASGVLACGEVGFGRLLEPDLIIEEISKRIESLPPQDITSSAFDLKSRLKNDRSYGHSLKVLITAGGTSEPIDDVRVITNRSTGKTAATLADHLIESGLDVAYLHSEAAQLPRNPARLMSFDSFADLSKKLQNELQTTHFDWVIHAAAVSDYSVAQDQQRQGKISSDSETITLNLIKNPKLIEKIKEWSPDTLLVGFKLTSTLPTGDISSSETKNEAKQKVNKLFAQAKCDIVIHNDWNEIKAQRHVFRLFKKSYSEPVFLNNIEELSAQLFQDLLAKEEKK